MKGLAFAYDPDGYWIELVSRDKEALHPEPYNLGQTMLRVKDIDKSLDFYTGEGGLGMTKASSDLGNIVLSVWRMCCGSIGLSSLGRESNPA